MISGENAESGRIIDVDYRRVSQRPLGASITAIWLVFLAVILAVATIAYWRGTASVTVFIGVAALLRIGVGLWRGEWFLYQFFRWLLVIGCVLNFFLLFAGHDRHGPLYRGGKIVVNGLWALYMFRPSVRAYFAQGRTNPR